MFRKLMPVAKKPWAKDATKKDDDDLGLTADEYKVKDTAEESEEEEDYEYYDDSAFHGNPSRNSSVASVDTRFSNIMDLKQASLYFDYKLSNRDLSAGGGLSPKRETSKKTKTPRMSTGIVPDATPETPSKAKNQPRSPVRQTRATAGSSGRSTQKSPPKNRFSSILSETSATVDTAIEEGSEEESDEDVRMVKVRSLSPERKRRTSATSPTPTGSRRPQLAKRNSWTSSRDMDMDEPKPSKPEGTKKKKGTGTKGKKKKKKEGAAGGEGSRAKSPARSPATKKKKKVNPDGKSTKSGGDTKSMKPVRRKMQRSNSWTSSRGLDTETGESDKKSSEAELMSVVKTPLKSTILRMKLPGVKIPQGRNMMEQLKKTKDFCTSMANITKKKDFDKDDAEEIQEQLAEALAQVELISAEQEKTLEYMTSASTEVEELKTMLAESAKENNELHDRLELIQSEMDDGRSEIDRYKENFETVLEEKNALADDINRTEVELRTLRSQMKRAEARHSVSRSSIASSGSAGSGGSFQSIGRTSMITGLQNDVYEKEALVLEQAEKIKEQDAKIEALEKRIIDGGGREAEEVIRLTDELEALKKEHKKTYLDTSVQLAKKEAMVARLQGSAGQGESEREELADEKIELEKELKNVKAQLSVAEAELEKSTHLQDKIKEMEGRVLDAETVEKGLQSAIDKWTDKTFEWKEKAEVLEAELMKLEGGGEENGAVQEEPRQSWSLFGS
jgi:hypothetical protein